MKAMFMAFWLAIFPAALTVPTLAVSNLAVPTLEQEKPIELSAEMQGDQYYALSNTVKQADAGLVNIDLAIAKYTKILDAGKIQPAILVKYVKACDFKYRYLMDSPAKKKKAYEALIRRFEPLEKRLSARKEYNYVMALLWGRRGEITQDVYDNDNKKVAEKIKKYAEILYGIDKSYQDYFAGKILGRVHYLSPNIPFVMPWPDRNKSKAYLEEAVKGNPGNTEAKMFLADTIWDTGDKKTAKKLYKQVANSIPRSDNWFYDTKTIKSCRERMKKLKLT